jgi:hypothetical protein
MGCDIKKNIWSASAAFEPNAPDMTPSNTSANLALAGTLKPYHGLTVFTLCVPDTITKTILLNYDIERAVSLFKDTMY